MKKNLLKITTICALAFALPAQAALIGTVDHDYGNTAGKYAPSSVLATDSCDSAHSNWLSIANADSCGRFYDEFNFSHMLYDSIDSFSLTITFSHTNNSLFGIIPSEYWNLRPASSPSNGGATGPSIGRVGSGITTKTFNFDNTMDMFNDIVANQSFFLWMAHEGFGQQNFRLYSASLAVNGIEAAAPTAVPTPAGIGLLGLGLALLGFSRRKTKK